MAVAHEPPPPPSPSFRDYVLRVWLGLGAKQRDEWGQVRAGVPAVQLSRRHEGQVPNYQHHWTSRSTAPEVSSGGLGAYHSGGQGADRRQMCTAL